MPWSFRPRKNFFPFANEKDLETVLGSVKLCILEWATIGAGQISHNIVKQIEDGGSPTKDNEAAAALDGDENAVEKSEAALIK